jgi:hypothetical protein
MSLIRYPQTSAYASSPQTSWYTGRLTFRPVPPDGTDQPYILQPRHQFRPDRLSYDLYQTPSYWWVFCERNPFLRGDPIFGFVEGLKIMVPSLSHLQQVLGA